MPVVGSIIDYELVVESKNRHHKDRRKNGGRLFPGDLIDFKGESRTGGRKLTNVQEYEYTAFFGIT